MGDKSARPQTTTSSTEDKEKKVCFAFQNGRCTKGNSCHFAHTITEKPCFAFQKGSCTKGRSCPFSHGAGGARPNRLLAALEQSQSAGGKRSASAGIQGGGMDNKRFRSQDAIRPEDMVIVKYNNSSAPLSRGLHYFIIYAGEYANERNGTNAGVRQRD